MKRNVFRFLWKGIASVKAGESARVHPTMKPLGLMRYCIGLMPDAGVIFDPYMGSGSTGVAAMELSRKFIGCEIHRPYFDIACERISRAQAQGALLPPEPAREQVQEGLL